MTSPRTYAEWLPLLDRFAEGDDSVVSLLSGGRIEWTNVVAERWTRQVSACLSVRLQALSKQLQSGLDRARGDRFAISNAIIIARRGLVPLRAFVSVPAYPSEVQAYLLSELDRWVSESQKSLEKHAEGIRHDQGLLLKAIRDNPLSAPTEAPAPIPIRETGDAVTSLTRGRRIIL
jgi:hypothetical protein